MAGVASMRRRRDRTAAREGFLGPTLQAQPRLSRLQAARSSPTRA